MTVKCDLTVMFEPPFWIGLYERFYNGVYEVCKITFGAEPKDCEVYSFLLCKFDYLKFGPPVKTDTVKERRFNPKRLRREINGLVTVSGMKTKARQALKLQLEQKKTERKTKSRRQKETERERQFVLRLEKKKAKHRGH